jgi:hypothetical protein
MTIHIFKKSIPLRVGDELFAAQEWTAIEAAMRHDRTKGREKWVP